MKNAFEIIKLETSFFIIIRIYMALFLFIF